MSRRSAWNWRASSPLFAARDTDSQVGGVEQLLFVALRDIQSEEEITFDYEWDWDGYVHAVTMYAASVSRVFLNMD